MTRLPIFFHICFVALLAAQCRAPTTLLFVGSYTDGQPKKGLKVYDLNVKTGASILLSEIDDIINPSFLQISEDGNVLFVISESQLTRNGSVSSYQVNRSSGLLTLINKQSTLGRNPVHIALSPDQKTILVSNYTDASISLYNIDLKGQLSKPIQHLVFQDSSVVQGRQDASHIHSSSFSANGKFVYAHDLGADKIRIFDLNDTLNDGQQSDLRIRPGSGPRHFTFDRRGKYGFLLSELSGSITAFKYENENGQLKEIGQYLTYEQEQIIYRAADIHISPLHNILYVSNRGPEENTIVSFKIVDDEGLEFFQRVSTEGEHPRNFAIDPSGNIIVIANQFSNNVVFRKVDKRTGLIEEVLGEIEFKMPSAVQLYTY